MHHEIPAEQTRSCNIPNLRSLLIFTEARKMGRKTLNSSQHSMLSIALIIALFSAPAVPETMDDHIQKNGRSSVTKNIKMDKRASMVTSFLKDKNLADLLWVDANKHKNANIFTNEENRFSADYGEQVTLSTSFYFYGHKIKDIEISQAGEIRSADDLNWFITPLTVETYGKSCTITFLECEKSFKVQWKISIEPFDDDDLDKELIFQVTVFHDGQIEFVYKKIPFGSLKSFPAQDIEILENFFGVKYIPVDELGEYPLHEDWSLGFLANTDEYEVEEGTIIRFVPLPLCSAFRTCESCSSAKMKLDTGTDFFCTWCPAIQRCSNKEDVFKDQWQMEDCDLQEIWNPQHCPIEEEEVPSDNYGFESVKYVFLLLLIILFCTFYKFKSLRRYIKIQP